MSPICRHSCLAPNSPYLAHLLYLWYCATRADLEHRTIFTCIHSEIRIMIRHSDLLNSDKNLLFQQSFHVWKSQLIKFDNGPYLFGNGVVKFWCGDVLKGLSTTIICQCKRKLIIYIMIIPLVISWIAEKPCNKIGLSKGQLTIPFSKKNCCQGQNQKHMPLVSLLVSVFCYVHLEF